MSRDAIDLLETEIDPNDDADAQKLRTERRVFIQQRALGLLLRRPDLFERYWHLIPKEKKPDHAFGVVATIVNDLHKKHGEIPTVDAVRDELLMTAPVEQMEWLETDVFPLLAAPDPRDVAQIEERLQQFAVAAVSGEVSKSVIWDDDVDPDTLRKTLEEGLRKLATVQGTALDGLEPYKNPALFPLDVKRPPTSRMIETPWDLVNQELGGMRTGEVFALTGPTGAGKSLYLDEIQAGLIRRGVNVFRVDFENTQEDLVVSHAFALLKQPLPDLTLEGAQNFLRKADQDSEKAGKPLGRLSIWCPSTANDVSARDVMEAVLNTERETGCEFPVIIIDYFDHLADQELMTTYRNVYQVQAKMLHQMTRFLRNLGKCAYTAFQTNRSGAAKKAAGEQVTMAEVAGSYGKIMAVQFHGIIDRDKQGGTSFKIDKCRRSGKLNGTQIKYEYVSAPCKTMNRGFLRQKEVKVNNPAATWAAKKVLLSKAIAEMNPDVAKGLALVRCEKGKRAGKFGVQHGDLADWLDGDPNVLALAMQDLKPLCSDYWRPASDFEDEKKVRFGKDGDQSGRWWVFK